MSELMNGKWIVTSIFQGVLDDTRLFDDEKTARLYAKRIKKFNDDEQDFDVTVWYRSTKKDAVLK
jgi:hypothetical protein